MRVYVIASLYRGFCANPARVRSPVNRPRIIEMVYKPEIAAFGVKRRIKLSRSARIYRFVVRKLARKRYIVDKAPVLAGAYARIL